VPDPTVIAVDWSGAKGSGRHKGIWLCAKDNDGEFSRGRWARAEVVDYVISTAGPIIVGFDFSFGLPAWFAHDQKCETVDDVWRRAEEMCDEWLLPNATPPFWNDRLVLPRDQQFRVCEERYTGAKSVFNLAAIGMVGPGSIRGMPHLARLREAGFAIWPFDDPDDRTVIEIYPTPLRALAPQHDVGPWRSDDERDAVVSARVMWDHRETVAALRAATDPTTRLEGDIWAPTASL